MTPTGLRAKVIAERSAWIREMLSQLRTLPLDTHKFKNNEIYIPEVLIAARAMDAGMAILKPILSKSATTRSDCKSISSLCAESHNLFVFEKFWIGEVLLSVESPKSPLHSPLD